MGKRSKACEFSAEVRHRIWERDHGCIFCRLGYKPSSEAGGYPQVMHYVARSHGGLGVEQNGALGCAYHHQMLDNGLYHDEMQKLFREYLEEHYPGWNESELTYDKWKIFKGGLNAAT